MNSYNGNKFEGNAWKKWENLTAEDEGLREREKIGAEAARDERGRERKKRGEKEVRSRA